MAGLPVQVAPAFACCAVLKCCVCSSHCKAQRYHAVPSLPVGRCTRYPCGVVISSHSTCTWHRLISPFSGCSFSGRRAVLCNTGTCTYTEGSNSTVQPTNPTAFLPYLTATTATARRGTADEAAEETDRQAARGSRDARPGRVAGGRWLRRWEIRVGTCDEADLAALEPGTRYSELRTAQHLRAPKSVT